MKNYTQNSEETNWPWVESPFFSELLKNQDLTDEQKELATKFNKDGYVVIDLGLSDDEIEQCKLDVNFLNNKDDANIQNPRYHYSQGKRVFEA